jgi:hypothetical protein
MDFSKILEQLTGERARIDDAIAALEKVAGTGGGGRGFRQRVARRRRRKLTPEGRKRLSEMMKKRWAERKRRAKAA